MVPAPCDEFIQTHEFIEIMISFEKDDFIKSLVKRFGEVSRAFFSRSCTQIDFESRFTSIL